MPEDKDWNLANSEQTGQPLAHNAQRDKAGTSSSASTAPPSTPPIKATDDEIDNLPAEYKEVINHIRNVANAVKEEHPDQSDQMNSVAHRLQSLTASLHAAKKDENHQLNKVHAEKLRCKQLLDRLAEEAAEIFTPDIQKNIQSVIKQNGTDIMTKLRNTETMWLLKFFGHYVPKTSKIDKKIKELPATALDYCNKLTADGQKSNDYITIGRLRRYLREHNNEQPTLNTTGGMYVDRDSNTVRVQFKDKAALQAFQTFVKSKIKDELDPAPTAAVELPTVSRKRKLGGDIINPQGSTPAELAADGAGIENAQPTGMQGP